MTTSVRDGQTDFIARDEMEESLGAICIICALPVVVSSISPCNRKDPSWEAALIGFAELTIARYCYEKVQC
jgi:hypothetical protein